MIKHLLTGLILLCCSLLCSQELLKPIDAVEAVAETKAPEKINLFQISQDQSPVIKETLENYVLVDFNPNKLKEFKETKNDFVEIEVPLANNETVTLQLVKTNLFEDNNYVKTFPSNELVKVDPGTHYRGIVKGKPETVVALSIFKDEVMGLATGLYGSNLVIGKLEGRDNHIIYMDNQMSRYQDVKCHMEDDNVSYTEEELAPESTMTTNSLDDKCVRLYMEVNYDVFRKKGTESATSNFVTGFMNQVMTLYANENIKTKLMPLGIWTQPSPYTATTTSGLMGQFQQVRTNWEGDLAQLLGFSGGGGIAAGFYGICNSDRRQSMSYSGIYPYYDIVPTFSWTVQVVTHEFGHIFGSRHTHACVWNGNGTAIDGCAGFVEGNCYKPGPPAGGGTIMSYCHLTNTGIDLSNGFGVQPGNVIRNKVRNGYCLVNCDGNPNPDPDPDPDPDPNPDPDPDPNCDKNNVKISVLTDNYPTETSWYIYNSEGEEVAKSSFYNLEDHLYEEYVCLEDGDYTFEIKDSQSDGICCTYGNGKYTVSVDGEELASGGDFNANEETEFHLGEVVVEPQCRNITLVYQTDKYAGETSWEIRDSNNVWVGGGTPDQDFKKYVIDGCLKPGCYTLTFFDTYNDGFCCSYGNGYYQFYEGNHMKLNKWANFGRKASHTICIGDDYSTSLGEIEVRSEIPPFTTEFNILSPFKNTLNIKFVDVKENIKIQNLKVTNMSGQVVYSQDNVSTNKVHSINTSFWAKGVYIVTFTNDNQLKSSKVIKD